MTMELMDAKGVRNYLPEEMIFRQSVVDRLKSIFEKYGFSPLETPATPPPASYLGVSATFHF